VGKRDVTYHDRSPNVREKYSAARYERRVRAAQRIAEFFGAPISSSKRTYVPPGGSTTSLHLEWNGALAFDFGAGTDRKAERKEKAVCMWAATHKDLFQEVMWHDVTTTEQAYHAHVSFMANVRFIERKVKRALRKNGKRFK
jgi:hypothetical protein